MNSARSSAWILAALAVAGGISLAINLLQAADKPKEKVNPIQIAEVKRDTPVEFEKEVLPIFRKNCLACHNATEAEGKLVLENPALILKGGADGPAAVAGKGVDSLLIKVASRQKEPVMPPPDNDVGAKPLTPEELGLIKLWIDQGAKGEVKSAASPIVWQPLPPGINPVYAVSISADGQFAAAGRANQIFLYHVPTKREIGRLTDPALLKTMPNAKPGQAHLDLVQSLAFSPDGQVLASGGFREVKFWRRPQNSKKLDLAAAEGPAKSLATSRDGRWAAYGEENGKVKIYDLQNGQIARTIEGHTGPVTGLSFSADGLRLATGSQDKSVRVVLTADGKLLGKIDTPAAVNAVAFVGEDKLVATGGADNIIRTWTAPAADAQPPAEAPKEAPKPVKELSGHTGPVNSLATIGTGAQLLSGSQDGSVRVWDVANGNSVRQMAHGSPVTAVAARPDGKRFASAGGTPVVKLWNGENGQAVGDVKGDYTLAIKAGESTRTAALAKRRVENGNKDLTELNNRKKQEEETLKKNEEAKKKADEDFMKKAEAAKKPEADKQMADQELEKAKAAFTKAEEVKKAADEVAKPADEAQKKAQADKEAPTKAAADADAALKKAQADKAPADKGLADAKDDAQKKAAQEKVDAAAKAVAEAEGKLKAANDAKAAADKAFADAEAKNKDAQAKKAAADKDFNTAQQAMQAADNKAKQISGPAQKAIDERNSAERTAQAAVRSIERSNEAIKQLGVEIPAATKVVADLTEAQKQRDMEQAAATKAITEGEKPLRLVAFSADGKLLATAGESGVVNTWDSETGAAAENFSGQGAPQVALAFAGNSLLVSVANNKSGVVYDTAAPWALERTIGSFENATQLIDRVTALDFSPDGKYLATGSGEPSRSGELKVWKVADGTLVQEIKEPHSDTIFSLEYSPDGTYIASCGADRFMKVFEVATGKFVKAFEGHTHHVLGVSWQMDGRVLASSGADKVIKIWDFRTGDQQRTVQGYNKEVTMVKFLRDPARIDRVVTASGDNRIRMIRAADGGSERDFQGPTDFMYAVAASADGNTVIGGGQDSTVRLWKGTDGALIIAFEAPKPEGMPTTPVMK